MSNPLILNVNRNWHFEFKPVYGLIMLFGIVLCFVAAFWQFNKSISFKEVVYQPLDFQGTFLDEHTYYIDNQTFEGKAGYSVVTPLASDGKIFLVNRGFIPYELRDQLPDVQDVKGKVNISGVLGPINKPILLNETLQDPIHKRLQYVDQAFISKQLNHKLEAEIITQQSGEGLLIPLPLKSPYLSHHRHQAYAIQWLILGLCGVFILLIASLKRGEFYE